MSDEEGEVEFVDTSGVEELDAAAPAAAEGELDPWITELIARVGVGASLSANDKARLPVALQLQASTTN